MNATKRTNLFARCIRKPFLLFLFSPIFLDKKRREKNKEKLFDNITVTWQKHKTNDGCFVFLCFSPVRYILSRIWYIVSPIRSRDVCHALCIRSLTFEKSWRRSEQNTRSRSRYFEMGSGERGLRMHCKPLLPPFPFPMQKTSYSYPKQFDAVLL